jgi:hypothetical protein
LKRSWLGIKEGIPMSKAKQFNIYECHRVGAFSMASVNPFKSKRGKWRRIKHSFATPQEAMAFLRGKMALLDFKGACWYKPRW